LGPRDLRRQRIIVAVVGGSGVVGIHVAVDRSAGGVDHVTGSAQPLHAAASSTSSRICLSRGFIDRMGRIISKIKEKRLRGIAGALILNPLLGASGEQIGGVAFVEVRTHIVGAVVAFLAAGTVKRFLRIMLVPVGMPLVAEEIIKAALGRK